VPHLAAGELAIAVGTKGGTEGIFVKSLKFPGAQMHKDSILLCVLWLKLVKSIKNCRKIQNSKLNFAVLSETRTTTFSKDVYTFEFYFYLKN
jgi:hypothetical protein